MELPEEVRFPDLKGSDVQGSRSVIGLVRIGHDAATVSNPRYETCRPYVPKWVAGQPMMVDRERMFPSLSLNQAALSLPLGIEITPSIVEPNSPKSTSSNTTPVDRSSAIAASKSSTRNPAAVALLVPAKSDR